MGEDRCFLDMPTEVESRTVEGDMEKRTELCPQKALATPVPQALSGPSWRCRAPLVLFHHLELCQGHPSPPRHGYA